ncbi:MAG: cyclic nucleotide-binding domain-containing protein [Planctomycetes bacterium]|nr:cyclic nucleotide-binding domain-containing protein [Planctomycetota bacterium]
MNSTTEKVRFLRSIDLFSELNEELLARLAERCGERTLIAGEALFSEGDPGDTLFVIEEGKIEIFKEEPWARTVIATLGPGSFFGEMAVLGGGRRTSSARAVEDATLVFLKEKAIRTILAKIPAVAFAIFSCLIHRLEESNRRLAGEEPDAPRPRLEVVEGRDKGAGKTIEVDRIEIGSGLDGPTPRPERMNLPRAGEDIADRQAEILRHQGVWYLAALSDSAPTDLNGEPVIGTVGLKQGDRIRLGPDTLLFKFS